MRTNVGLTQARLKELLNYEPSTGKFSWANAAGRYGRIPAGSIAGSVNTEGYNTITIDGVCYRSARLAHFYMTGQWPSHQIDHINLDEGDDRWENLREATQSQNKQNNGTRKDSSTGYKCVTFDKDRNCYTVRVKVGSRRLRLGRFETAEEAFEAYKAKIGALHGEYANAGIHS